MRRLRAWGRGRGPGGPGRRRGGARGGATERGKGLGAPWAGPGGMCVGKGGGVDGRHPAGPAPAAPKLEAMNNLHPNLVVTANHCKLLRISIQFETIISNYYGLLYRTGYYRTIATSLLQITVLLLQNYDCITTDNF